MYKCPATEMEDIVEQQSKMLLMAREGYVMYTNKYLVLPMENNPAMGTLCLAH